MEWISVKDRLPKTQEMVLVKTRDQREEWQYIVLSLYDGKGFFIDTGNKFWSGPCDANIEFEFEEITHWMPLPEAPKTN